MFSRIQNYRKKKHHTLRALEIEDIIQSPLGGGKMKYLTTYHLAINIRIHKKFTQYTGVTSVFI